jgi:hypothetical protein
VRRCVRCAEGENGQRKFSYYLYSLITGNNTNMMLMIVLCLIAKLMLVSGDCDIGTQDVKNFDWYKVGISVLT